MTWVRDQAIFNDSGPILSVLPAKSSLHFDSWQKRPLTNQCEKIAFTEELEGSKEVKGCRKVLDRCDDGMLKMLRGTALTVIPGDFPFYVNDMKALIDVNK